MNQTSWTQAHKRAFLHTELRTAGTMAIGDRAAAIVSERRWRVEASRNAPIPSPLDIHAAAADDNLHATIDFECGNGALKSVLQESAEDVQSLTAALLII